MKKCVFPKLNFLALFLLTMGLNNFMNAQESEIDPQVAQKIAPGLFIHPAAGSYSTIFSGKDGLLIIDTGMPFEAAKSDSLIQSQFKKPIKYLINSHSHYDHAGGNKYFADDATIIIAHENARKEMLSVWEKPKELGLRLPVIQPYTDESLPDICYYDSLEIHFNDENIKLYHVPDAHTTGDTYVFFQKLNAIHTGDIFITLNAFPPFEGSFNGLIRSLDVLIKRCDENTIVIPGHGPVSNRNDVIKFKEILLTAYDKIIKLKEEGNSFEEIVNAHPLAGLLTGKKYIPDRMFIYSVFYGHW